MIDPLDWRTRVRHWVGPLPLVDVLIGAFFVLSAVISLALIADYGPYPIYVANSALELAIAAAAFGRRRYLRASFAAIFALLAVYAVLHALSPVNLGLSPILFAAPASIWAITRWAPHRGWGVSALVLGVIGATVNPGVTAWEFHPARIAAFGIPAVVIVAVSYAWPAWLRSNAERHALEVRAATESQRLELSRELHDIVGHGLTAIKVQAQTALYLDDQHDSLASIRDTADDSLSQVRALVDMLRDGDAAATSSDPRAIPALIASSPLKLETILPDNSQLAAAAEWPLRQRLTLVRLVLETLTNMAKHGDGTGQLRLDISDACLFEASNPIGKTTHSPGAGYGLTGLEERLEALGGHLTAGSGGDRFHLKAEFPL